MMRYATALVMSVAATGAWAGTIVRAPFGTMLYGQAVEAVTLAGAGSMRVIVITLGASIRAVLAPDRTGAVALPLVDKVPHGQWRTLTFLAALRHDRIDAPLVLDGPINGQSFTAGVEQLLLPTLLPRPQPDRAGLRQAQNAAPQSRTALGRSSMAPDRLPPRHLPARRVRQLSPQ